MTRFRYRAVAQGGELTTGFIEAAGRPEALERLRRMGLLPVEAEPGEGNAVPWYRREIGRRSGPNAQGVATLVEELAVLLDAGLPLDRALAILEAEAEHKALRPVLEDVLERVRSGTPLADAMRPHPKVFGPMAIALVEAGQAAGNLREALARLAEMMLRAEQLREQIRSALIYPVLLVLAAGGSVLILLGVVVPQFESFFEGSRVSLPLATVIVMGASRGLRDHGMIAALALGLGGFALHRAASTPTGRRMRDRMLLRLPLLGSLLARVETARFARTLGTLLESGVALTAALTIATRTFQNQVIVEAMAEVGEALKQGRGLSRPLEATGLLPPIAITFVRTGEEAGRLGEMLVRLAEALDREVRKSTQRLMALLVPIITIVLGVIVALIVGAILSAMLSLNELAA